jgi:hypothetical protein
MVAGWWGRSNPLIDPRLQLEISPSQLSRSIISFRFTRNLDQNTGFGSKMRTFTSEIETG